LGRVQEVGVALGMADWQGTVAGVGDLVQARRNAWHLEGWQGNTAVPVNRTTYRVTALPPDGGLTVARVIGRDPDGIEQLGAPMQLPASYVSEHVTLAYAATVHAAQGRTVDAGYPVLGPGTDTASAYVALTRGRHSNVAFVITRPVAEGAETGETFKVAPRGPAEVLTDVIRPPDVDPNRTALTEAEDAAAHARVTATHVDPLIEVIADTIAGRTAGWLDQLAADGALPERHRMTLAADEARSTLDQLLRTAELAGHDPAQLLRDAVTASSLDKSTSVAQVLHFRIRSALAGKLDPQVASYADLLPREVPEHSRAGLEALAHAADTRRTELSAQLGENPTQWAREALGPVPDAADDPAGRADWERKAGSAASYRELVEHTDDADPLGAAPPTGLAEKHALFRTAHRALDLADAGADEETMTEGQLRARVTAYRREEAWAPRYVADELDATHQTLRTHRADATVWAARAAAEPDPAAAEQLRAAAEAAREQAEQLAVLAAELETADEARALWWSETAATRDNAERARVALGLRGIDIDNPADRVTAQEWLAADQVEKLAADPYRAITEHDLADLHDTDHNAADQHDRTHRVAEPHDVNEDRGAELVHEPIPDIRDTAVPDPGERVDPTQRRRVPLPHETAATVDRAQLALTEIKARRAAEAAEAAHTAQVERAADDRRDDFNRWAAHDQHTDDTTGRDRVAAHEEGEFLER